jgi:CTP:molybdopterin cytidylyltransferase MocA
VKTNQPEQGMNTTEYLAAQHSAGAQAMGLLECLFESGDIPAIHRDCARRIIAAWPRKPLPQQDDAAEAALRG